MAQGVYTVATDPVRAREYPNKHGGTLVVWRLGLQDAESQAPDGLFELHKKEGNDPPSVGDRIEVERTQAGDFNGEPFTRLYVAYNPQGSSNGRSSDPPDRFDRKPEHPRNEARMIHTSALSATPGYINQGIAFGVMDAPKDEDAYWKLVGKVATKLVRSYERALEPPAQPQLQQEVAADTTGLQPIPARSDDSIPF